MNRTPLRHNIQAVMKVSLPGLIILYGCLFLISCGGRGSGDGPQMDRKTSIKLKQYMVQGKKLYQRHCSNCHQEDGSGLRKLIPPLERADYLKDNAGQVVCAIKYGLQGEITVNGVVYRQPMPANEQLTPLEIAEITTYVYNAFGEVQKLISVKAVDRMLKDCHAN